LLLTLVALLACWLPARRAASTGDRNPKRQRVRSNRSRDCPRNRPPRCEESDLGAPWMRRYKRSGFESARPAQVAAGSRPPWIRSPVSTSACPCRARARRRAWVWCRCGQQA
jgi:hypothetical protein